MQSLRDKRFEKNMSQFELANKAGVSQSCISTAENGLHTPQPKNRERIEAILGKIKWNINKNQQR